MRDIIGIICVVVSWVVMTVMTSQLMVWIGSHPSLLEQTYGGNIWKSVLIFSLAFAVYGFGRLLVED